LALFNLSDINSIANNYISELRDINIQSDRMRFRYNMERVGQILAFELSKTLDYENREVQTPLGKSIIPLIRASPVIVTIMRAGLPFLQGFLDVFDKSDAAFIGAYRTQMDSNNHFSIDMNYIASGSLEGKELIIVDPMLATGKSIIKAIKQIVTLGNPSRIHIVSLIASRAGYQYVKENTDYATMIWIGAIDEKLNDKSYIIPGLGDAGDLCYGEKV
jgi:uracil phosphoribosyltransferase